MFLKLLLIVTATAFSASVQADGGDSEAAQGGCVVNIPNYTIPHFNNLLGKDTKVTVKNDKGPDVVFKKEEIENVSCTKIDGSIKEKPRFDLLENLRSLKIKDSSLRGLFPSKKKKTRFVHLEELELSGMVFDSLEALSEMTSLTSLILRPSNNKGLDFFSPLSNSNMKDLQKLRLWGFNFNSSLPSTALSHLLSLEELSIQNSSLTGKLDDLEIGKLTKLTCVNFGENYFTGAVPDFLQYLPRLKEIKLGFNKLQQQIPSWLGNYTDLNVLELKNNRLNGSVPEEIGNLTSLKILDLSNNKLNSEITPALGQLRNLNVLDLSNNKMNGTIPTELAEMSALEELRLFNNNLTGPIPDLSSLGQLTSLRIVGTNHLTGHVPEEMVGLLGAGLQIPDNDLETFIPTPTVSPTDSTNSPTDSPAPTTRSPTVNPTPKIPELPDSSDQPGQKNPSLHEQDMHIAFIVLSVGLIISLFGVYFFRPRKRSHK